MTPLRQRMAEDMQIRNFSENTQKSYLQQVSLFARHFARSPEGLGPANIRDYQLYLTNENGVREEFPPEPPRSIGIFKRFRRNPLRFKIGLQHSARRRTDVVGNERLVLRNFFGKLHTQN